MDSKGFGGQGDKACMGEVSPGGVSGTFAFSLRLDHGCAQVVKSLGNTTVRLRFLAELELHRKLKTAKLSGKLCKAITSKRCICQKKNYSPNHRSVLCKTT
jgi:hypothetical protein